MEWFLSEPEETASAVGGLGEAAEPTSYAAAGSESGGT